MVPMIPFSLLSAFFYPYFLEHIFACLIIRRASLIPTSLTYANRTPHPHSCDRMTQYASQIAFFFLFIFRRSTSLYFSFAGHGARTFSNFLDT